MIAARAGAVAVLAASALITLSAPARADRCDDLATQLKGQIDGLSVGKTAANSIYLAHPAAKTVRLGCASRNVSNELSATADGRKASPAFFELVSAATAVIFTIPKADTLRGAKRCVGRIGLFRGDDIKTRYRRLDIHCVRTKNDLTITISREKDA
jgi:hypothetical protein